MLNTALIKKTACAICLVSLGCIPVLFSSGAAPPLPADRVGSAPLAPQAIHTKTNREIFRELQKRHYRRMTIDDSLSSRLLDSYLKDLDPSRSYFYQSDIDAFEAYRTQLDDAMVAKNLVPAFAIFNRYRQRLAERLDFMINKIERGPKRLKFDKPDELETDREEAPWLSTVGEMDALWSRRLKLAVLRLKLADKTVEEAADILLKRFRNQKNRAGQMKEGDAFEIYMNAFARLYDPHTQYFSPRDTDNFHISMSLSLEGIGAYLKNEDEFTKIVRLVPAGPADKSKQLKPGDRIVGVGQGAGSEIVDVVGWRIDDVVDLIRGPKETVVSLEIIPVDAADDQDTRVVKIVRNQVKLEEQAAREKIIAQGRGAQAVKIGVIDIPAFYQDFNAYMDGDPNYRSTTRDVKRLLKRLVDEPVDGIIIDLRDNSGGSLQEVNSLTGLFIEQGPVVQVRSADGRVEKMDDPDPQIFFSGPLVVLVNRLSASASEIFAAAVQDYRRGVIMGGQTFGKGTVQTLVRLRHGQLKATQAKFYRVSGDSTQIKGVTPDLVYPGLYDASEIGESALPDALPWDQLPPASYRPWPDWGGVIAELDRRYRDRIQKDPDYNYRRERMAHIEEIRSQTRITLQESRRRQEREAIRQRELTLENKRRVARQMEPFQSFSELEKDREEQIANQDDADDPELNEACKVLADLIELIQGQTPN